MSHPDEVPPSVDVLLARIAGLEAENADLKNMVAAEVGLRQTAEAEGKTWQHLAYVDALTGMFNRHHGDAVFQEHQNERKDKQCGLDASGSTRFTILFIDLDRFRTDQ
jgi:GGDEF domain-containing protein